MTADHTLLYLVGVPGAGKSTLMRALLPAPTDSATQPVPHQLYGDPPWAAQLGQYRPEFPGTDTLAMNVAPKARTWLASRPFRLILAEGDRLANLGFFAAAANSDYRVHVIGLDVAEQLAHARRAQRLSHQNPTWLKGRHTKYERLISHAPYLPGVHVDIFDASQSTALLVAALHRRVPILHELTSGNTPTT